MFEYDRSAARGQMVARRREAFKHDSQLGNGRAHELFDRVTCSRNGDADGQPPRGFNDYSVDVDTDDLPQGITVEEWV